MLCTLYLIKRYWRKSCLYSWFKYYF